MKTNIANLDKEYVKEMDKTGNYTQQRNEQENKKRIIMETHIILGHANAKAVRKFMKPNFFWTTMREDIIKIIKSCEECLLFNKEKSYKNIIHC